MADKYTGLTIEKFNKGWQTDLEFDALPIDALTEAQNIDFMGKRALRPRRGTLVLGTESTNTNPIYLVHTARKTNGEEILFRFRDTVIEWWNTVDEDWDIMSSGITAGAEYGRVDEFEDEMFMSNGTDGMERVPLGYGVIDSNTATVITLKTRAGATTAALQGFPSSGTVTVDGTEYTYSGISGLTLTGLSALPTFSVNEGVIHTALTAGFTSAPTTATMVLIKDRRAFVPQGSSVYVSNIGDAKDFSFNASRAAGEGEIIKFESGKIQAIADAGSYVALFGKDFIHTLVFENFGGYDDLPTVNQVKGLGRGPNTGAETATGVGEKRDTVIFASSDIGLTLLGSDEGTDFAENVRTLTERIRPDAEEFDFSDTAVFIFDRRTYNAVKDTSSSGFNNNVIVYDIVDDWFTKWTNINATSFTIFNGKLYFGDSITQNVREMNIEGRYDDDGFPYTVRAKTKWFNEKVDFKTKQFASMPERLGEMRWLYVEGWITQSTQFTLRINYDEGGDLGTYSVTFDGAGDYVSQSTAKATFGPSPFGVRGFSRVTSTSEFGNHFRRFIPLSNFRSKKFYNFQIEIESSQAGANWAITRLKPFVAALPVEKGRKYST